MGLLAKLLTTALLKQAVIIVIRAIYDQIDKINIPNVSPSTNAEIKKALKLLLDNIQVIFNAVEPSIKLGLHNVFQPTVLAYEKPPVPEKE